MARHSRLREHRSNLVAYTNRDAIRDLVMAEDMGEAIKQLEEDEFAVIHSTVCKLSPHANKVLIQELRNQQLEHMTRFRANAHLL